MLVILNLRGVKESVTFLAPIFVVFIATHILLIGYGILSHTGQIKPLINEVHFNFNSGITTVGFVGVLAIFLRAFSMGAGTYTGIEAVSNGMQIMRDPKVQTGKRTMVYMACSLAITAGGLLVCYLLFRIRPVEGRTLNAILAGEVFYNWPLGGMIALITILSEGRFLLWQRRLVLSTARGSCQTWPLTHGFPAALHHSQSASQCRMGSFSWVLLPLFSSSTPVVLSPPW